MSCSNRAGDFLTYLPVRLPVHCTHYTCVFMCMRQRLTLGILPPNSCISCFYLFETGSLSSPDLTKEAWDPPASASLILGLPVCATIPGFWVLIFHLVDLGWVEFLT